MINPIYMPFTCLGAAQRELLASCFDGIELYQPLSDDKTPEMQQWVDEGFLTIQTPGSGDDKVKELLAAYRNWNALHQDHALAYLKATRKDIPFFDDTLPSSLRTAIKNYEDPTIRAEDQAPYLRERLFLQMAQEFDLHQMSIRKDLDALRQQEQSLLHTLHDETGMPENEHPFTGPSQDENSGDFMIEQRLTAWTIFPRLSGKIPPFYVTTSEAVCDHFEEIWDQMEAVASIPNIPLNTDEIPTGIPWRQSLAQCLAEYLENPADTAPLETIPIPPEPSNSAAATLTVFRISHSTPREFYRRWSKVAFEIPATAEGSARQHTILALVRENN
jgi:hypothetical protein